jgi:hypothetical protein
MSGIRVKVEVIDLGVINGVINQGVITPCLKEYGSK